MKIGSINYPVVNTGGFGWTRSPFSDGVQKGRTRTKADIRDASGTSSMRPTKPTSLAGSTILGRRLVKRGIRKLI